MAITTFLILFILTNNNFEKKTNRLFLAAACCVLVLIVTEAWEAQLALGAAYTPLRVALSAVGYSLRPMVPYFLLLMVKGNTGKQVVWLTLPLAFNILTSFSALFTPIAFGYTADNAFVRGPLGFTPFLAAGFYVAVLLWLTIRSYRHGGFMETLIISAMVLLAFLSTVMESLFHFQFIQNPSIATSITFYYLFLHSNQSNRDPLTGALTRRRFYLDADKYASTLTAVISLDLNDLKTLNDRYGHTEGDRALVAVTNLFKKHAGVRVSLYRTGGDEFMILCYKLKEDAVKEIVSAIRRDLEQTKYRCAIGYAMYSCQANFELACQQADQVMYENKRRMKSGLPEPGGS